MGEGPVYQPFELDPTQCREGAIHAQYAVGAEIPPATFERGTLQME